MATETWRPARDFTGYEVSDHGRIRNSRGRIMKLSDNGLGYKRFSRNINGEYKREYVHRLVAFAFVPNPLGKPCINHIDCDPTNNNALNLEWCTKAENTAYMKRLGRNKRTEAWIQHLNDGLNFMRKAVIGTSLKTGESVYYEGINKVARDGFQPSCVTNCCKGIRKQHKGHTWRYAEMEGYICLNGYR